MPSKQHREMVLPTIIDIEASGFGRDSYPIEVGLAFPFGERYCSLIQPLPQWTHWDEEAGRLHGIKKEQLEACGKPIIDVCRELNEILADKRVYSDAWVFDKAWLNKLFDVAGCAPTFYLSPIESIQTECQHVSWDRVRSELMNELDVRRHRASADAFLVQSVYQRTREFCEHKQLA